MVDYMEKQNRKYHLFLFLSSFSRGLIEPFSLVVLYKKGFSVQIILLYLFFTYILGIICCYVWIRMDKKIGILLSNVFYGISFLLLSFLSFNYLFLFFMAVMFSFGYYSYHVIRHYYAFFMLKNNNNTYFIVFMMCLGVIISSLLGSVFLEYFNVFLISLIVFIISIISVIPIYKYYDSKMVNISNNCKVVIGKRKVIFSILEQFKVLFMELQPLFLYLYVNNSYFYVGVFQFIMNLSSLFVWGFISRYLSLKHFKYVAIGLGIILFFKVYFNFSFLLFGIAFLEGILVKIYEMFSLKNLYNYNDNNISSYLMKEEFIFLSSKGIIILLCIFCGIDFKLILLFFIIGIMGSGFFIE